MWWLHIRMRSWNNGWCNPISWKMLSRIKSSRGLLKWNNFDGQMATNIFKLTAKTPAITVMVIIILQCMTWYIQLTFNNLKMQSPFDCSGTIKIAWVNNKHLTIIKKINFENSWINGGNIIMATKYFWTLAKNLWWQCAWIKLWWKNRVN